MVPKKHEARLQEWFEKHAASKHARFWLGVIAFTESSFFPIPADPFLAMVLLVERKKWWQYSLYVTFLSVVGGLFGYVIGAGLYELLAEPIVNLYNLQDEFHHVTRLFESYTFWTVFTAAFTPIPYKIFTIAAGVAQVNLMSFMLASLIGRGLRFMIVGFIMKTFGKQMGALFFRYFNIITSLIVLLIVLYIAAKIVL